MRRGSLVLLDTNAAFLPFRERLPLEDEVDRVLPGAELAVPAAVKAELERLVARGTAHAASAREFVRRLRSVGTTARGDGAVVEAAVRERATVVTADRALAQRLSSAGIAVLSPRDRVRLDLKVPRAPTGAPRPARSTVRRPKR